MKEQLTDYIDYNDYEYAVTLTFKSFTRNGTPIKREQMLSSLRQLDAFMNDLIYGGRWFREQAQNIRWVCTVESGNNEIKNPHLHLAVGFNEDTTAEQKLLYCESLEEKWEERDNARDVLVTDITSDAWFDYIIKEQTSLTDIVLWTDFKVI